MDSIRQSYGNHPTQGTIFMTLTPPVRRLISACATVLLIGCSAYAGARLGTEIGIIRATVSIQAAASDSQLESSPIH
ncbi:hypothetical protein [Vibrio mediterranei]|uniref:hypothetical protein n=1 Tax=Vibrio mediterranei TaxID=689 RepID=UPI00228425F9|nr:hypothetical protein [Vibrio mediterranei]MCY9855397.1 hypothetical protein [Vibrio mediterranei]